VRFARLIVAFLFALWPALAHADFTVDDTHQAIYEASVNHGVSHALLRRLVRCETGGTFRPDMVGDHGTSFGPMQLHAPGELNTFYRLGYTDPSNPYEALDYAAQAILAGRGPRWSCW